LRGKTDSPHCSSPNAALKEWNFPALASFSP
jgi:hypothetical protein